MFQRIQSQLELSPLQSSRVGSGSGPKKSYVINCAFLLWNLTLRHFLFKKLPHWLNVFDIKVNSNKPLIRFQIKYFFLYLFLIYGKVVIQHKLKLFIYILFARRYLLTFHGVKWTYLSHSASLISNVIKYRGRQLRYIIAYIVSNLNEHNA